MDLTEVVCALPGERYVQVQAAPASAGFPVLVHPGTPGCRLLSAAAVQQAANKGLRLIAWDRPGYADRPGEPGRRIADGAAEAAAVADSLGLDRFAAWGFSGGGGYALACAALCADRVTAAVVMATLAPYEALGDAWAAHWSADSQAEVRRFFDDRAQARVNFKAEVDNYYPVLSDPEGWLSRWGDRAETDEAHSREVAEHLARHCGEALRNGDEGWWEDHVAYLTPWGFDLGDISVPVQLWHGIADRAARAAHGRWLAEHIPGVDPHLLADEDHTNVEMLHQAQAWEWILRVTNGVSPSDRR